MRNEDIPPHLRPNEPKRVPEQIPLQDLPPADPGPDREDTNDKQQPPDPFLRRT